MFNVFAMNEYDREIAIAEKAYEIGTAEVAYMEAMIDSKLKMNMARCEYKIMTESTAENAQSDLVFLYNEAGKEAEANKEGVLTKIKNGIVSFFVTVWNSIQKVFTKVDTESYKKLKASQEKVKVGMNIPYIVDIGEKISNATGGNPGDMLKKVLAAVGITTGVFAGWEGLSHFNEKVKSPVEMTKSAAVASFEKIKDLMNKILGGVKGTNVEASTNDPSATENATNGFSIIKAVGSVLAKAFSAIKKVLGIGDVEEEGAKPEAQDGGQEPTPTKESAEDNAATGETDQVIPEE